MDTNIVNDITEIYFGQIAESSHLETDMKKRRKDNEKAVEDMKKTDAYKSMAATAAKKFDEALDPVGQEDDDVDNDGKKNTRSDKYLLKRRKAIGKAISTQEAKEVKRWWDDDGDGKGYEPGEVSGKFKKKKTVKEGRSNWRQDLSEVISDSKTEKKITEKKVNNKIVINPKLDLGEAVENLGGQLLEMVEIENVETIFDDMTDFEVFLLSDQLIEEVVEEFFYECLDEGYDIGEVENDLIETIELSSEILNEALGHDTQIKSDRLEKVKGAVKKVGKAVARGAGYVAGAAVRGARAVGREFKAGYQRGSGGSSGSSATTSSGSSSASSSATGTKRPGLLGRIGSALKSGLKKAVAKGARAVSRGARNVARRMDGGSSSTSTPTQKSTSPKPAPKKEKPSDPWEGSYKKSSDAKPAPKKKAEKPADPWAGSETTPPKAKTKKPTETKAPAKRKRKSKLDNLLASVRADESVNLGEKTLTTAETKKKEDIVKSMKDKSADFEKRYPGRGKEVMYATATKIAKKIAEQAMELQPQKKQQQQQDRTRQQEVQILQRKLQALRSAPKGTDPSITA
jgi:hypothetical protein